MKFIEPHEHPHLCEEDRQLVKQITAFVQSYFQDPKFDASHDFQHVRRVTNTAIRILNAEQDGHVKANGKSLNALTVILGALLHDVDDRKYCTDESRSQPLVVEVLLRYHLPEAYAHEVNDLAQGVSFSSEIKDPARLQALSDRIPELAVVQDADRLDAIGAIGIGRCFTFGGAKGAKGMGRAIEHFEEKLLKLEEMMKTETGKVIAGEKSLRVRQFMKWWQDENGPEHGE